MANLSMENEKWLVKAEGIGASYSKELATNGKYLDRNIVIDIDVQAGSVELDKALGKVNVTDGFVTSDSSITLDKSEHSAVVEIDDEAGYFTSTVTSYPVTATAHGVTTQGWTAETTDSDEVTDTIYIKEGTVTNAPTVDRMAYATNTVGAVVRDDESDDAFLYIDAGYVENMKISLADLVPDKASVGAATSSDKIYKGVTAYNVDGTLITGTMSDAVIAPTAEVSASQTITVTDAKVGTAADGMYTLAAETTDITGTIAVGVETVGYLETPKTSEAVEGQASTVVKVAAADTSVKTLEVNGAKPALSNSTISIADVTDAAASGATTTAPESGVYVKVDASAAAGTKGSVKADVNVLAGGYVKAGEYSEATIDTTLVDADALYVPIKQGSATVTVTDINANDGIVITGSQEDGYQVTVTADGMTAPSVTEGWIKSIAPSPVAVSGSASLDATKLTQKGVVDTDFVIEASAGYNAATLTTTIPVYQGETVGA